MITHRELVTSLQSLQVEKCKPVIAHACLSICWHVSGGVDTLLGALLTVFQQVIMPAFLSFVMIHWHYDVINTSVNATLLIKPIWGRHEACTDSL